MIDQTTISADCAYTGFLESVHNMHTFEFLQAILPEHGIHYLALFKDGYKFPAHKVYTDLETMADAIDNMAGSRQVSVYHACATYERAVIEIEDADGKVKRKYRVPENWSRAKSFWVDLDCGQEKFDKGQGYLTKRDAAVAIDKFSVEVGWPKPMLVDSGNGLHAYWPLTKDIAHDKWVKVAKGLKVTLFQCGVLADPTRTADFASILRPAGSVNRKNGEAKPVTVLRAANPAEPDVLDLMLTKFMAGRDVVAKGMPFYEDGGQRLNGDLTEHLKGEEGLASAFDVKSALQHLDPGMARDQWRTVVWAVRHGLGHTAEGIDLADLWSKGGLSAEFNTPINYSGRHDVEQVWNSYDSNHMNRVSVGSLYKMATDKGWSRPGEALGTSNDQSHGPVSVINAWTGTFKLSDGGVSILQTPPAKRSYILANTVTAGTYNVLAGSGGTLKTMLMLITAASMAAGQDLGEVQIAQGASMLFLGEEDHAEVVRRLSAVCVHYGFDPAVVSRLVKVFPAAGVDLRLTRERNGSLEASALVQNIIALAQQHAQLCGDPVRLVVIDHARLAMDGDPDDAAHVTQLTRVLTQIAQKTGASVMLLAHSPKTVLKQQAKEMSIADVAGSSAFSDNARSGFVMYGMREDDAKALQIPDADRKKYVKLECAKANYGPQGSEWWFEKVTLEDWQVQVLEPTTLIKPLFVKGQATQQLHSRILSYLLKQPGRTRRQLRKESGKAKLLAASEKVVEEAIKTLLEDGRVELRIPSPAECVTHRLPRGRKLLFVTQV